jgi:DNA-binding NtrC family response regulator
MSDKKSPRILVVEDEEVIRFNLEAFLKDEGFEVRLVSSGEECLDVLEKEKIKIDLAIIDMRLPQMDGNVAILEARRIDPTMKFIVYTGSSGYVLPQELLDIGLKPDQILRKPLQDMGVLTQLINKMLENNPDLPSSSDENRH